MSDYMTDQPHSLNHRDDASTMGDLLPPDLVPVAERLTTDGIFWQARLPDVESVAERIRAIPAQAQPSIAREDHLLLTTPNPHSDMPPAPPRLDEGPTGYKAPPGPAKRLFGLVAAVVLVALLATLFAQMANRGAQTTGPAASPTPTLAQPTATDTATPTPSSTATPTPTSTANAAPGGQPTSTPTSGGLTVTNMNLVMHSKSYSGVCAETTTYTFTLTIDVAPNTGGGTVDVNWIFAGATSSYTSPPPTSLTTGWDPDFTDVAPTDFAPGETAKSIDYQLPINAVEGDGKPLTLQAQTSGPNRISSPVAHFSLTCIHVITSMTATASPASISQSCGSTQTITVTFAVTISPGPYETAFISPEFSQGFTAWQAPGPIEWATVSGTSGDASFTYTIQNGLNGQAPNGTYWGELHFGWSADGVNTYTTSQATVVKNC